jgi:hypothetical protein
MVITTTSDSIQIVLGAAVTTNQLTFVASFNDYTSTGVTPTKNASTTNNTTAVDIIPAPPSGSSRELRYCSIFNCDSEAATVTVTGNFGGTPRTMISVKLAVNDYIQYTHRTGWKVFDMNGSLKNYDNFKLFTDHRAAVWSCATGLTTGLSIATTTYCVYLGKALAPYSLINVYYGLATAITATITWAEIAIYTGKPTLGTGTTLTRIAFLDTSTLWQGAGLKSSNFQVDGIEAGDDLWVVFGNSTTGTSVSIRTYNVVDDIGAGFLQTSASNRPSTNTTLTGTVVSATTCPAFFWNGI